VLVAVMNSPVILAFLENTADGGCVSESEGSNEVSGFCDGSSIALGVFFIMLVTAAAHAIRFRWAEFADPFMICRQVTSWQTPRTIITDFKDARLGPGRPSTFSDVIAPPTYPARILTPFRWNCFKEMERNNLTKLPSGLLLKRLHRAIIYGERFAEERRSVYVFTPEFIYYPREFIIKFGRPAKLSSWIPKEISVSGKGVVCFNLRYTFIIAHMVDIFI
jgi:hypothetical protein